MVFTQKQSGSNNVIGRMARSNLSRRLVAKLDYEEAVPVTAIGSFQSGRIGA